MSSKKSKTGYVILGLLNEENLSGYEIKRIVDDRLSFFWNESFGQIYPELKRLVSEGLIDLCEEVRPRSNKQSTKYQITEPGRLELQEWLQAPVEKELIRYEILLKLYFSNSASSATMLEHVKEFQNNHRRQQHLFKQFEVQLKQNIDVHSNHKQILMVLSFGQKMWESYAAWCEETIHLLEQDVTGLEDDSNV
jgi:DNA-binding PadR family transcriptional regulator